MSVIAAQVVIPGGSSLAKDAAVNTFHFGTSGAGVDATAAPLIKAALVSFYHDINASGGRPSGWFAKSRNSQNARIKLYRLNDPTPRVPLLDEAADLGAPGTTNLPEECAVVLSFQSQKVSGVNQAHRRNRIFFGPLSQSAVTDDANTMARPSTTFRNALVGAAVALKAASAAAADWEWIVYSPALGVANTASVHDGWCDDAFDTQRRRGVDPTSRITF